MREDYILKIRDLLDECVDMATLDLIYQLLREG